MKKFKQFCMMIGLGFCVSIACANNVVESMVTGAATATNTCVPGDAKTSSAYLAVKWYRDSAERNAQYNQVFHVGLEKVTQHVREDKLPPKTWGVILDIDETVLDNTAYEKASVLSCQNYSVKTWYTFLDKSISLATPGAVNFTCAIEREGGWIALVTNRNGKYDNKIVAATIQNLKRVGICFDTVLFATSDAKLGQDKNPRFDAILSGKYSSQLLVTKTLPVLQVLAYFGDNIQDFPHMYQKDAMKQDPDSDFYAKFGEEYFSLPNPIYGSWMGNKFN